MPAAENPRSSVTLNGIQCYNRNPPVTNSLHLPRLPDIHNIIVM